MAAYTHAVNALQCQSALLWLMYIVAIGAGQFGKFMNTAGPVMTQFPCVTIQTDRVLFRHSLAVIENNRWQVADTFTHQQMRGTGAMAGLTTRLPITHRGIGMVSKAMHGLQDIVRRYVTVA